MANAPPPKQNTVKFIKSLQPEKIRRQEMAFFVEGAKNVTELLLSDSPLPIVLLTDIPFRAADSVG